MSGYIMSSGSPEPGYVIGAGWSGVITSGGEKGYTFSGGYSGVMTGGGSPDRSIFPGNPR